MAGVPGTLACAARAEAVRPSRRNAASLGSGPGLPLTTCLHQALTYVLTTSAEGSTELGCPAAALLPKPPGSGCETILLR